MFIPEKTSSHHSESGGYFYSQREASTHSVQMGGRGQGGLHNRLLQPVEDQDPHGQKVTV